MPGERADARQHADQRADQAAEKGVPENGGLQRDREPEQQECRVVSTTAKNRTGRLGSGDLAHLLNKAEGDATTAAL